MEKTKNETTTLLKNKERLDDLNIKGYQIIQDPERFCFGMDAVLLSGFANIKKGDKEYLIPVIKDVVKKVDIDSGIVEITPLKGIFDDED